MAGGHHECEFCEYTCRTFKDMVAHDAECRMKQGGGSIDDEIEVEDVEVDLTTSDSQPVGRRNTTVTFSPIHAPRPVPVSHEPKTKTFIGTYVLNRTVFCILFLLHSFLPITKYICCNCIECYQSITVKCNRLQKDLQAYNYSIKMVNPYHGQMVSEVARFSMQLMLVWSCRLRKTPRGLRGRVRLRRRG